MIIDMHTHAGRPNRTGPVDRSVLATMAPGGMAAAVVSAIADLPMIHRNPQTKRLEKVRDPNPGECLQAVDDYLASFEATGMRIAREPHEIRAGACPRALDPGDPALVLAVEGCDFLEGDLDRLDTLEARGVRSIQLTHYLVNETGDIQTAPPVHGGLTPFGAETVRRMNRLGIIVDVAHCSEDTVKGVVAAATKPILCTHANLKEPGHPDGDHPRYLSLDYARMVAGTGGVIGAWIAVLWQEQLAGLIRHMFRLIDAVGIDHVGIGTDLPAGAAKQAMPDFSRHHKIADALRQNGMTEDEVAKVCAGNWLRVFPRGARVMDRRDTDALKRAAAEAAAALVESGMAVGLGTGSTAAFAIAALIRRTRQEGLNFVGIPTSERSAIQAREGGLRLTDFSHHRRLDLTIDGADEIARDTLHLVKGGGGALLREKIVAAASDRLVIIADASKLVDRLGLTVRVPVEVVVFGWETTADRLSRMVEPQLRMRADGTAFRTDGGNYILDCTCGAIADPAALQSALVQMVGVVDSGLFVGMADVAFVAGREGVVRLERSPGTAAA